MLVVLLLALQPAQVESLGSGDHTRSIEVGGLKRSYIAHIPPRLDLRKPTPVVLALHGAGMNGSMMVWFSGLNDKADRSGFIVVYPSGTGTGPFLTWNAGGFRGNLAAGKPDDVKFIDKLLDDLATVVKIDSNRVYACGMSNGGMMCYRLAAELSERIAAIAPVAGTIAIAESKPTKAVPVIHFHGTDDTIVPYGRNNGKSGAAFIRFQTVEESVQTWVKLNECRVKPVTQRLSRDGEDFNVTRDTYSAGKAGAEVVLIRIEGGGHTWPGKKPPVGFIGRSALNVSANDLMWDFFQKHERKR